MSDTLENVTHLFWFQDVNQEAVAETVTLKMNAYRNFETGPGALESFDERIPSGKKSSLVAYLISSASPETELNSY